MSEFVFQQFSLNHSKSSMKIGTDAILLGAFAYIDQADKILEIGTGSGIIALMLAQRSSAYISAIDIHEPSVFQARENFESSPWSNRLRAIHSSLQKFNPECTYDQIISNPPYFSNSLKSASENKNLARHNDTLSPDELAWHVKRLLTEKGCFSCILPYDQKSGYCRAFNAVSLYPQKIINIHPKPSRDINRVILQFSKQEITPRTTSFTLRDSDNNYSAEYRILTKDFHPEKH